MANLHSVDRVRAGSEFGEPFDALRLRRGPVVENSSSHSSSFVPEKSCGLLVQGFSGGKGANGFRLYGVDELDSVQIR